MAGGKMKFKVGDIITKEANWRYFKIIGIDDNGKVARLEVESPHQKKTGWLARRDYVFKGYDNFNEYRLVKSRNGIDIKEEKDYYKWLSERS